MKNIVLGLLLIASTASFAGADHNHQPAFGKHCAYSVMHGKFDVDANEDYSVTYKKKTYFFSSEEARDKFIENIRPNISKAEKAWEKRPLHERR